MFLIFALKLGSCYSSEILRHENFLLVNTFQSYSKKGWPAKNELLYTCEIILLLSKKKVTKKKKKKESETCQVNLLKAAMDFLDFNLVNCNVSKDVSNIFKYNLVNCNVSKDQRETCQVNSPL